MSPKPDVGVIISPLCHTSLLSSFSFSHIVVPSPSCCHSLLSWPYFLFLLFLFFPLFLLSPPFLCCPPSLLPTLQAGAHSGGGVILIPFSHCSTISQVVACEAEGDVFHCQLSLCAVILITCNPPHALS